MRTRVVNIITRMIVGGPQQVSLLAAEYYRDRPDHEYFLVTGPESGREGHYGAEMERLGLSTVEVPSLVRELSPIRDPQALLALLQLLRRLRPEVVHSRTAKARFLGSLAARLAGVPAVVQTVHGWSFNNAVDRRKPIFVALERLAAACCHCTVLVSETDLAEGLRLGILPEDAVARGRAAIIRSGVDLSRVCRSPAAERDRLRQELDSTGRKVVSLVQRLSPPKTPEVFVDAFRVVAAAHPDAVAWIVGDGDLREETQRAVAAAGLAERTRFLGLRKDVPAVLSASDVVVHSSIREGLPRVVLEALAVGTPLVATAVGGVGEVLRSGDNGLSVPPLDPTALAAAIRDVLEDDAAAQRRCAAGRASLYPFSALKMLDDQDALYRRLLAQGGPSPRPR